MRLEKCNLVIILVLQFDEGIVKMCHCIFCKYRLQFEYFPKKTDFQKDLISFIFDCLRLVLDNQTKRKLSLFESGAFSRQIFKLLMVQRDFISESVKAKIIFRYTDHAFLLIVDMTS